MARTRSSTKRKADSDVGQVDEPQQKLPMRTKSDELLESKAPTTATQGNLIVFGDDDDNVAVPVIQKPAAPQERESEEESDDDAAPEVVSTQNAASSIRKSTQEAQKVAQEQAAAQKRKRKQRDTLFKQQAEERKKAEEAEKANAATEHPARDPAVRREIQAPNLLPAEFLTDPSSEDEDEDENPTRAVSQPKRRKVAAVERNLTHMDKGPRDERVGSTVYRVAKKTDEKLPPKAKQYSKSSKDVLLRRDRTAVKPRAGFFKK